VRKGKDIRSDNDIIDEEVIKPITTKSTPSSTTDQPMDSVSEDLHNAQTHEEPSVKQLIKYKQQIRIESDRRLHRENLVKLANNQREKEQFFQSDLSKTSEQQQQQKLDDHDQTSSQVVPTETATTNKSHKPIVQSKEEEDILNDENIFQCRQHRHRGKQRDRLPISHANTPYQRGRQTTDFQPLMKRELICKVCGNTMTEEDNQLIVNAQQVSGTFIYLEDEELIVFSLLAAPTARSNQLPPSAQSAESAGGTVDDWFEAASEASGSRQLSPMPPDDATLPPTGSSTFRRNLFQPINNKNSETVGNQSPIRPLIPTDVQTNSKRLISPRVSESGIFARSPEPKIRPPSSTRSNPSPVTKRHQTDTNHQLSQPSPTKLIPTSTTERRMSGWSVREHSPDHSDEN
jgi:hypothetical protein